MKKFFAKAMPYVYRSIDAAYDWLISVLGKQRQIAALLILALTPPALAFLLFWWMVGPVTGVIMFFVTLALWGFLAAATLAARITI